ncbi:hypothetical protein PsorP6_007610 [Peronosclerospora sorghi]|uniref:Uncharacterized protein n=1 Tax=Peronosclerospora sorghi TaxID=230839 RepID=A0ACC0WBT7_9STRA|nr:hypothetical protein PsorP6_007610 [Peronosclerospora sorghi]
MAMIKLAEVLCSDLSSTRKRKTVNPFVIFQRANTGSIWKGPVLLRNPHPNLMIWNHATQSLVKTLKLSTLPVRNAKFVARKQWIAASSDDMQVRTSFEAHTDYIRNIEVHPTLPCFLTCADDMTIKLWDWDKNFTCKQVFEGHGNYVMMVEFNPKDAHSFASACLDRTVRVWGFGSSHAHFSLEGYERGVNCVACYPGGEKPYLLSGSDDRTVKVWDYQTKAIVHTLDGHGNNLTSVLYHP